MNSLQVLPFYNPNDQQFNVLNGLWLDMIDTDQFNLMPNPDKSDLMVTIPMLNHHSIYPINNSISKAAQKPFQCFTVIWHLPKN